MLHLFALVALLIATGDTGQSTRPDVEIIANDAERRVDVKIDGRPFTAYVYPETSKKPVLYPLRTAKGTLVTRGFPFAPRSGERVDHPHHAGLWFNHGDVNGFDFWNNSTAVPSDRAAKMGTIRHRRISGIVSGADQGELHVEMEWVGGDGVSLLRERTMFVFRGGSNSRSIDRITTLSALEQPVVFRDNKEGVLGLRVARALEMPDAKGAGSPDPSGRPAARPANAGPTGIYFSSEGLRGEAVWGTRGRWAMLTGTVESEPVTIAILDHPSNPGYPTYWHARGYGLFAANMLGQKVFTNGVRELNLRLEPGQSATFRHRVLILDGTATPQVIEQQHRAFVR